jgi:hypothetical protein
LINVWNRFVNIFFREERLPIEEGWKRSPVLIDAPSLDPLQDQIAEAADWTPDGDCPTITFVAGFNASETIQI